jgi:hypothetical protein
VRSDAARIAAEIRRVLAAPEEDGAGREPRDSIALRHLIQLADNLAAERGATRVGLALTEPVTTGSPAWDAAIAAVCEYRLNEASLPVPEWVGRRPGRPEDPWQPAVSDYPFPVDTNQVPPEFLSRGVLIEAADLESV